MKNNIATPELASMIQTMSDEEQIITEVMRSWRRNRLRERTMQNEKKNWKPSQRFAEGCRNIRRPLFGKRSSPCTFIRPAL